MIDIIMLKMFLFNRLFVVCFADDGREISVPVLLDGVESIMEFIDLPYSGVSKIGRAHV